MNAVTATRAGTIDDRPIAVFDGLISQETNVEIAKALENAPFTRTEVARPDTAHARHWAHNMKIEDAVRLPIYSPTQAASAVLGPAESGYRAYRAYCNYSSYGDMLFTHTDAADDAHELTALWFLAPQWDVEWGGETLFFNADMDAEFVVSPRPGRLVVFDGRIAHVGKPPNRICFASRFTFAYKLEPQ